MTVEIADSTSPAGISVSEIHLPSYTFCPVTTTTRIAFYVNRA